jgi:hypothetical protein
MQPTEFDECFGSLVAQPLVARGFVSKGKSFRLTESDGMISFIRLGGRMATMHGASWVLCFRHCCLRELFKFDVFDYPYKFKPSELQTGQADLRYYPRIGHYDYDQFRYGGMKPKAGAAKLIEITQLILGEFVPWAASLTPERACAEIQRYGSNAWCEKLWIEDYQKRGEKASL